MTNINYESLSDEQLINCFSCGDMQALETLIIRYKNVVKIISRTYFMIGADQEDIIQEGMIGLYKSIKDYNKDYNCSFYSFAKMCIERNVINAIKTANRKKHQPLNNCLSLNVFVNDEGDGTSFLSNFTTDNSFNPEQIFLDKQNFIDFQNKIESLLSSFEKQVLFLYLKGKSYLEISIKLNKDEKAIDNAIQRIRKKYIKFFN